MNTKRNAPRWMHWLAAAMGFGGAIAVLVLPWWKYSSLPGFGWMAAIIVLCAIGAAVAGAWVLLDTTRTTGRQQQYAPRNRDSGFTLLELLVVISIIVLLIGIGLVIGPAITGQGESNLAESTMAHLSGVSTEYYATTGRFFDHRTGDDTQAVVQAVSGEHFVKAAMKIGSCQTMLGALPDEVLKDTDANGIPEVFDGWGTRIVYVALVDHADGFTGDDFLPETPKSSRFDFATQQIVTYTPIKGYFASVGVDGKWGTADDVRTW